MLLDYDKKYREAYHENVKDAPRAAREGELNTKIESFCKLHGFEKERVIEEIATNEVVAALFAINPNKQNFYEKIAAQFIRGINGVEMFTELHTNEKILMSGAVLSATQLAEQGGSPNAKTIDFEWRYSDHTFYASHKYTKQSGGTQDSQYRELKMFIEEANKTTLTNTFFIAIADGEYYDQINGRANTKRIDRLKEIANKTKVFACNICELEELMKRITD